MTIIRQFVVLVSMIAAIVGSLIGSGVLGGTPIAQAAGGALSADATPLAPAGPAFSIWSVIYLGLAAYSIWQLLPKQRADPRQRRLGYPIAASLLLNAAWILSVQAGWLVVSAVVISLLLVVLAYTFRICIITRPAGWVEAVVVDGVVGLYLGWVCVATIANITAVVTAAGLANWVLSRDAWAVIIIAVAGLIGVAVAIGGRGRFSVAASLCWGLAWVAVARLTGELRSTPAAIAAIAAAVVILLATTGLRVRAATLPRR